MTTAASDILSNFKQLKSIGFSESQAEALADKIHKTEMEEHMVTKNFLREQLEDLEIRIGMKIIGMAIALGSLILTVKYFG